MAGTVGLPPGFELDQPKAPSSVPEGFVVDGAKPKYTGAYGFTGPAVPRQGPMADMIAPQKYVSSADDPNEVSLYKGLQGMFDLVDMAANGAGDYASRGAHALGASPEVSGGVGMAANMGVNAAPSILGAPVAEGVGALTKPLGKWLMGTALKPTWEAWSKGKADRAIDTMLNEPGTVTKGINVSEGGMNTLRTRSAELSEQVKALLAPSTGTVDKKLVTNYGQDAADKFSNHPNALRAQDDVINSMDQFYNHPLISGQANIPVQQAQNLKQGYYKALGDKSYDELKTPTTEAEKAIARGLKEQIEKVVPEVAPLNARNRELINALKVGDRRVQMSNNNNPLGLAAISPSAGGLVALLADKWGMGKSALARVLYSAVPDSAKAAIPAAQWAESIKRKD